MSVAVRTGHVVDVLAGLAPRQFQVCVTSPPYLWLRAYGTEPQVWAGDETPLCVDGTHEWGEPTRSGITGAFCLHCGAWRGELGSEPTVELYIAHLVQVFRAVRRVLRDDGTCWVNLAGCYFNNPGGQNGGYGTLSEKVRTANRQAGRQDRTGRVGKTYWLKPLDYVDVPGLFAQAMVRDGWLWRSDMALVKWAPMPESVSGWAWQRCRVKVAPSQQKGGHGGAVKLADPTAQYNVGMAPPAEWADCPGCTRCEKTDGYVLRRGNGRPTRAWERLLVFAKGSGAFWDSEGSKEPNSSLEQLAHNLRYAKVYDAHTNGAASRQPGNVNSVGIHARPGGIGHNLRDWQRWEGESFRGEHYAAYPSFIPRLALRAGTSRAGCCTICGAPWARVIEKSVHFEGGSGKAGNTPNGKYAGTAQAVSGDYDIRTGPVVETRTLSWRPTCSCGPDAGVRPCAILDPFVGSGTSLLVAQEMGLDGTGVDLNGAYAQMAVRRNTTEYTERTQEADGTVELRQHDLFTFAASLPFAEGPQG